METIRATYKVVTPLFSSRADQEAFDLSAASFKGVLRFWWRALAFKEFGNELGLLKAEENKIFGSSAEGQSPFLIKMSRNSASTVSASNFIQSDRQTLGYLGYGLSDNNRKGLIPGTEITLDLCARERGALVPLIEPLKVLGLLGGMGSRSRRGFGSLTLMKLEGLGETWTRPGNTIDLKKVLENYSIINPVELPGYSAFSVSSQIRIGQKGSDPKRLLSNLGNVFKGYRRDFRGSFFDQDLDRDFPRKIALGLPYKDLGGRRSSPLMFHIHELGIKDYVTVVSFLPSRFSSIEVQNFPEYVDFTGVQEFFKLPFFLGENG